MEEASPIELPRTRLGWSLTALLNHDFCPRFNPWLDWIKRPVWALCLALLAALLIGWGVNPRVFDAAAGLAICLAVGVVYPVVSMRGVSASLRLLRPRTEVGEGVEGVITITNRWPWPVWGLSLHGGFGEAGVSVARVDGWARCEFRWLVVPAERGVYPRETPWLETGFPWGFWTARTPVSVAGELLVWPDTRRLNNIPDIAARTQLDDQTSLERSGEFGDLLGTRPLVEGDSLRRVHWAQTARYQRLIVCERQAGRLASVRVWLDTTSAHFDSAADYEMALAVFLSVCESLDREHAAVEACLAGRTFQLSGAREAYRRLGDTVARLPQSGTVSGAELPIPRPAHDDALLLVITGRRLAGSHRFHGARCRVIGIGSPELASSGPCWICLASGELDQLPQRWRRGCHVNS